MIFVNIMMGGPIENIVNIHKREAYVKCHITLYSPFVPELEVARVVSKG